MWGSGFWAYIGVWELGIGFRRTHKKIEPKVERGEQSKGVLRKPVQSGKGIGNLLLLRFTVLFDCLYVLWPDYTLRPTPSPLLHPPLHCPSWSKCLRSQFMSFEFLLCLVSEKNVEKQKWDFLGSQLGIGFLEIAAKHGLRNFFVRAFAQSGVGLWVFHILFKIT